jgi:hypothetical protein
MVANLRHVVISILQKYNFVVSLHLFAFPHCYIFALLHFRIVTFSHCYIFAVLHFRIVAFSFFRIVTFSYFRVPIIHAHGDISHITYMQIQWPKVNSTPLFDSIYVINLRMLNRNAKIRNYEHVKIKQCEKSENKTMRKSQMQQCKKWIYDR